MGKSYLFLLVFIFFSSLLFATATVPPNTNLAAETYNFATATLPSTPGLKPRYNVPLPADAENIVDLTFGTTATGATITSVAELGNVAYFFALFGTPSNVRTNPIDGSPNNFQGVYTFYPEFLANGSRNPLAVHQILSDRLRLVARTAMNGSTSGAKYETGSIRLPTQFLPGMMAEITLAPGGWPTCQYSWPTFWAFSGAQLQGAQGNVSRWYCANYPLENDGFDGYPLDSGTIGTSIPSGCPTYTDQSVYNYPDDIYLQATGDLRYFAAGGYNAGMTRLYTSPSNNPTNASNPGLTVIMDWTDINTIKFIYNGELVRIRHVYNAGWLTNGFGSGYDGTPPPASLLGTTMPMHIIATHQFGVNANVKDLATLSQTTTPIVANYDITSIRMWNRASTMVPVGSTPSPGPLPSPITGTALGTLPQISTGTYLMNVEVVNGVGMDHFGAKVALFGDAQVVTTGSNLINSLPVLFVQTAGGVSIQGPAISYAQNGGNFLLFMVVLNRNPYISSNLAYCQFVRQYPSTDALYDKAILYMNPMQYLVAQIESSTTSDLTQTNSTGKVGALVSQLVVLNQSLAIDGTVTLGVGMGNRFNTPPPGRGVPAAQLSGYTELLLGAARNRYNQLSGGANLLIGQVIMVGTGAGNTMSDADILTVSKYLTTKWNLAGMTNTVITRNSTGMQPQPGTFTPPAKASFSAVNAQTLTVTGGSPSPLTLSQPAQTTNNTAMELISLPSGAYTLTALVSTNLTYGIPVVNGITYNGIHAGIALRNSAGNVTTFGLMFQNFMGGSFRAYWYAPTAPYNSSYAVEARRWYASSGRNIWMRVVVNPTANTTSFLSSATGRVNEWETLFSIPTALNKFNQIGFYVNAYAGASASGSGLITIYHLDTNTSFNPQGQAGSYTSNFAVIPTASPTSPTCNTYQTSFTAADASNSLLTGLTDGNLASFETSNTVVGGGQLQLINNNAGCPSACGGATYAIGGWRHNANLTYGQFNFTAIGPTSTGTGLILCGTNHVNGLAYAVRMFLLGSQHSQLSFDIFVGGVQYVITPVTLPFDHTTGYHTYSFTWTSTGVTFYADGKLVTTTTHTPNQPLLMAATYEVNPSWGTFTYPGATSVYLNNVYYLATC